MYIASCANYFFFQEIKCCCGSIDAWVGGVVVGNGCVLGTAHQRVTHVVGVEIVGCQEVHVGVVSNGLRQRMGNINQRRETMSA